MRIGIASSSLRKLDAVALATNVTIPMKRGTERTFAGGWGTRLRVGGTRFAGRTGGAARRMISSLQ